jgi:hypothetical protein
MSTNATAEVLTRLHVRVRPIEDIEAPFEDAPVSGSLALALPAVLPPVAPETPAGTPVTAPPLRLVPDPEPELDDEDFAPQRTPRDQLPDPAPRAAMLARAVLEALSGDRPVSQLLPWTSDVVYDDLETRVDPTGPRPWAAALRRIRVCEPVPGVAEVAAVVQRGPRASALAMRLEGIDGRWLLTALAIG